MIGKTERVTFIGPKKLVFICAWICFYALGRTLLKLPSDFHANNLFNATWKSGDAP